MLSLGYQKILVGWSDLLLPPPPFLRFLLVVAAGSGAYGDRHVL
jgi:hypothetical protein